MKTPTLPGNTKSTPKWVASQGAHWAAVTFYENDGFNKFRILPSYNFFRDTFTNLRASGPRAILDSQVGSLKSQRVTNRPRSMVIWQTDYYYSEIVSDDIGGGIIYQKADDRVFVTDTADTLTSISPTDCFNDLPSVASFFIYQDCLVTNCAACNHFNISQCRRCNPGLLLSVDLNACLPICNPTFNLNGRCYNRCPVEYYHLFQPSNECITETYCSTTLGKNVLGSQCVASCPPGGSVNASGFCLAPSGSAPQSDNAANYVIKCPAGELFWEHFQQCTPITSLPTTGYTTTATTIYCDGATHFFDIDSHRCLQTCTLLQGSSPTMGKFCASTATCTTALAWFFDSGTLKCVASCAAVQWTNMLARSCISGCPPGSVSIASAKTCEASCPVNTYFLAKNSSCLTSAECTALGLSPAEKTGGNLCAEGLCGIGKILEERNNSCVTQCPDSSTEDRKYCRRLAVALIVASAEPTFDTLIIKIQVRFNIEPLEIITSLTGDLTPVVGSLCLAGKSKVQDEFCDLKLVSAAYEDKELVLKVQYSSLPPQTYEAVVVDLKSAVYFKANGYRSFFADQQIRGLVTRFSAGDAELMSKIRPIALGSSKFSNVAMAATPFLLTGSIDLRLSSVLCLAAQTYAKLTLMTYMNFTLSKNVVADLYYDTFREFLDQYNEVLVGLVIGPSTIQELVDYVCEMEFAKYCFLNIIDNFWISKFLDFLILIVNLMLVGFLLLIVTLLKNKKWKTEITNNLKSVLLITFLVDNNLSFQFNLLLNLATPIYREGFYSTMKAAGIILILPYLLFHSLFWFRKKLENKKLLNFVSSTFSKLVQTLKGLAAKEKGEELATVILVHDMVFAVCLMTSKFAGMGQVIFWILMEILYLVVIIKRRFLANTALLIRQIVAETMFLLLSCAMVATHFGPQTRTRYRG